MAATEFKSGDLFTEPADAIVNTVNCRGAMGKGLALQFKQRFPGNYAAYRAACEAGEVRPGRMFVYRASGIGMPRFIINFPTKDDWRVPSRLEWIDEGLADLSRVIREQGIASIAIPALGCDLGGLDWGDVRPRIAAMLAGHEGLRAVVFEPRRTAVRGRRAAAPAYAEPRQAAFQLD